MRIKGIRPLVILLLIIFNVVVTSDILKADEMYYDTTGQAIALKWNIYSNGKAYLRVNGDGLSGNYSPYYPTARNAWNNVVNKVTTVQSAKSTARVVLSTTSTTSWERLLGDRGYLVAGITYPQDTNGLTIRDLSTAKQSTRLINYATIYFTPYNNLFPNDSYNKTRRTGIMVHEIGHALGLGHPRTSVTSIMNRSIAINFYLPQTKDKNDIANKY